MGKIIQNDVLVVFFCIVFRECDVSNYWNYKQCFRNISCAGAGVSCALNQGFLSQVFKLKKEVEVDEDDSGVVATVDCLRVMDRALESTTCLLQSFSLPEGSLLPILQRMLTTIGQGERWQDFGKK